MSWMTRGTCLVVGLTLALSLATSSRTLAAPEGESVRDLSQFVWALQTLHDLEFTNAQLKGLSALVAQTQPAASKVEPPAEVNHPEPKVLPKFVRALKAVRDAILKGEDDDTIAELRDEVESIREDNDVDADDTVTVTTAARQEVATVLKMLAPSQVASYIATYQDEVPDPVDSLMDALDDLRGASDQDAKDTIADTAHTVAMLIAGITPEKYEPIEAKLKEWLASKRPPSATHSEIEASARELLGEADPFDILRHWLQRDIAELLSNPQLKMAIDAQLSRNK